MGRREDKDKDNDHQEEKAKEKAKEEEEKISSLSFDNSAVYSRTRNVRA